MNVQIRTRRLLDSDQARRHVRRRLNFALGRFAAEVEEVRVSLERVNGSNGDAEARCRLQVVRRGGGRAILAKAVNPETFAAVDRAAELLSRAIARELDKQHRRRRVTALAS